MNFEEKINELKIKLPEAKAPVGSYMATKISGKLLFISGQISIDENGELIKGKVGKDLDTDEAYQAAKRCGLSIVSQVKKACGGDLSKIKSCIKLTGFVKAIKPENKLDVVLGKPGFGRVEDEQEKILRLLQENDGYLPYHDKSDPEEIYNFFGMSKKSFKMTTGTLYKQRKIEFTQTGIKRVEE